jgi:antitoxin YefM
MSPEDLAALEDTLELLSDPSAMAEIEATRYEVAQGKTIGDDELRAKYLSR